MGGGGGGVEGGLTPQLQIVCREGYNGVTLESSKQLSEIKTKLNT